MSQLNVKVRQTTQGKKGFTRISSMIDYRDDKDLLFCSRVFVCITFCLVLFVVGILSLALPKPAVSEYEKRALAGMPEFSANELFWGSYLRDVELHYADTFPFREGFVRIAGRLEQMRGIRLDGVRIIESKPAEPAPVQEMPVPVPVQPEDGTASRPEPVMPSVVDDGAIGEQTSDGMFIYKNKAMAIFGGSKDMGDYYAQTLNSYAAAFGPGVRTYNVVIPTSIEFGLPGRYKSVTNSQKDAIDNIYGQLEDVIPVDAYSALQWHSDEYIYFNTDHHWTGLGAYYAYTAFCDAAGVAPLALEDYEMRNLGEKFLGTLYSESNDSQLENAADSVDYYIVPGEITAYRYDTPAQKTATTVWADYAAGAYSYSVFLHGDFPMMEIHNDVGNGRKAVVIKESFGNAFAPFLIAHYDEVYVVDQRYYEAGLVSLVKEKGIDDVIFINNVFASNTGIRIKEIAGMLY